MTTFADTASTKSLVNAVTLNQCDYIEIVALGRNQYYH